MCLRPVSRSLWGLLPSTLGDSAPGVNALGGQGAPAGAGHKPTQRGRAGSLSGAIQVHCVQRKHQNPGDGRESHSCIGSRGVRVRRRTDRRTDGRSHACSTGSAQGAGGDRVAPQLMQHMRCLPRASSKPGLRPGARGFLPF